jgi:anti-sigma factor RsiW
MNCPQIREQLPLFVYGDLPATEAVEIERHLTECTACQNQDAALRQVRVALESTPAPEVFVNSGQIFLTAAERPVHRRWLRSAFTCGLAASLVVLAIFNVELRADGHQLVIRWGRLPEAKVAVDRGQPATTALAALEERVRILQDLTHALARDVDFRDRARNDEWIRTKSQLDSLTRLTGQQLVDAQRDVDALYAAHFKSKTE